MYSLPHSTQNMKALGVSPHLSLNDNGSTRGVEFSMESVGDGNNYMARGKVVTRHYLQRCHSKSFDILEENMGIE
ncbi:hypothetical protein KOW79_001401 [Hemibagrus wyckioides]|uniref:Uncharacterized protein n=1 Tax=Hemibagrus wyckioides TaxID=337641 RepID=A0A9D3STV4_9TELE|nr:hypothetical protein KOW79_001401 [Hemibagrus wyckioides]